MTESLALHTKRMELRRCLALTLIDVRIFSPSLSELAAVTGATLNIVTTSLLAAAIVVSLFAFIQRFSLRAFSLSYSTEGRDKIGHELNQFEQRQLIK